MDEKISENLMGGHREKIFFRKIRNFLDEQEQLVWTKERIKQNHIYSQRAIS